MAWPQLWLRTIKLGGEWGGWVAQGDTQSTIPPLDRREKGNRLPDSPANQPCGHPLWPPSQCCGEWLKLLASRGDPLKARGIPLKTLILLRERKTETKSRSVSGALGMKCLSAVSFSPHGAICLGKPQSQWGLISPAGPPCGFHQLQGGKVAAQMCIQAGRGGWGSLGSLWIKWMWEIPTLWLRNRWPWAFLGPYMGLSLLFLM